MSHISHSCLMFMSHVHISYLMSMSHILYLMSMSHVPYLMSMSHISYLIFHVSCLMSVFWAVCKFQQQKNRKLAFFKYMYTFRRKQQKFWCTHCGAEWLLVLRHISDSSDRTDRLRSIAAVSIILSSFLRNTADVSEFTNIFRLAENSL